jgi:hypothetical protein
MKITLRNLAVTKGIGWDVLMIISGCVFAPMALETSGYAAIMKAERLT